MGYFIRQRSTHYYAIMHKYSGPVFIKPGPMSYNELTTAIRDNRKRDLVLTQICGQEEKPGQITFATYWERAPGVEFEVWFPGSDNADSQRLRFESTGFRLAYLCGYSENGRGRYVGIWQKPKNSTGQQYEAHYGLTLDSCMRKNKMLTSKGFAATSFRVFNNNNQVLCTAIWEQQPSRRSFVVIGDNLNSINFRRRPEILPRQISHFVDNRGVVKFVVLWSDLHSNRFPDIAPIWQKRAIPVRFLQGTPELLTEPQLDFLIERVEHFMRDLNIPGLSIAIAKREQLKFAAGTVLLTFKHTSGFQESLLMNASPAINASSARRLSHIDVEFVGVHSRFGYADLRKEEIVTPNHQFRVGSVSKPITAAAVMLLVDQGKVALDDKLFGLDSIFENKFTRRKSYRKYVTDVTVRHLLEHSAGGWDNLQSDPAWIQQHLSTEKLIEYVLENVPLEYMPGTRWIYSNFGYQLLGYLVEHLAGTSYENFVKTSIFGPAGVHEIQVARPGISEKASREVIYYMSGNRLGFDPYEMLPSDRIGPWGGWIASPIQMLLFMVDLN
ncbi:beta-lactamase [Ancylostoma duodenale]|uniref:Beta-lactamase n=1 Tax=Ancylostoma duodenale TaxID=51022 RepID=A0A0C2DDZ9_9BILA|nr:beta-lactamase [Ancylostoma duodenale]